MEQFLTNLEIPETLNQDTVIDLIRQQNPKNPVLQLNGDFLSYGDFERKSDELAYKLIGLGIGHEEKIIVMFPLSFELVISIYAILKAGGAYVPVNAGDDRERFKFIIDDLNCQYVLGDKKSLLKISGISDATLIEVDKSKLNSKTVKLPKISPSDLAYIIYTSGTTGRPKGVMVEHGNLFAFISSMNQVVETSPGDRWLQNPNITFDFSVGTMFMSLCNGSSLVLWEGDLAETMEKEKVTHYLGTPGAATLIDPKRLPHLKIFSVGGEKVPDELIGRFSPYCNIIDAYGPAEATIIVSWTRLNNLLKSHIGKVLPNVKFYVVKQDGALAQSGESGELWIGGPFVVRGYLNRRDLTDEKFIKNPFGLGRVYKTGDKVRWTDPEEMEYQGRIDRQVKIRGNRVELDGVEKVISSFPDIKVSYVKVINDNLVAYVVAKDSKEIELLTYLKKILPAYAIPNKILFLDNFPLTRSGKIDSASLPDPFVIKNRGGNAPKSEKELLLASLWESILPGKNIVYLEDNFFDLGGTSLHVMKLTEKLRKTLGNPKIPLELVYENPVFKNLEQALNSLKVQDEMTLKELGGPLKLSLSLLKCLPSMILFSVGIFIPFWTFLALVFIYPPFILFAVFEYLILNSTGPIEIPILRKFFYSPFFHKNAFKKVEILGETNFKSAIICMHPHGVTDCHFYPLATHLNKSGIDFKIAFDKGQMNLPLNRFMHGIIGYVQAMEESYINCKNQERSIVVTPGEKIEWLNSHSEATLFLRHNINLFKIAIKTGMPLVPVYSYNMHKTFKFYPELLKALDKLPVAPGSAFLPFFRGRWGLPIPFKQDLKLVIGDPIKVTQNDNPSWDEVELVYTTYVDSLKKLYAKHAPRNAKTLEIN